MTNTEKSKFSIEKWDEKENNEWESGKLSRTICTKKFDGNFNGNSKLEAIMLRMECDQNPMAYIGVEHINCTLDGRTGSFILIHNAEALGEDQQSTLKILPGSGTGDLVGITGSGEITPDHFFILSYELETVNA